MNKKIILPTVIGLIILAASFSLLAGKPKAPAGGQSPAAPVKEFTMQSFVDLASGAPKPQFDPKEITVKKGDLVRLKITVTKGSHDFKIDEFNVYADTKLNQEEIVEFIADKAGEFIYYCTKPGHRAAGHWGTLKVTE